MRLATLSKYCCPWNSKRLPRGRMKSKPVIKSDLVARRTSCIQPIGLIAPERLQVPPPCKDPWAAVSGTWES